MMKLFYIVLITSISLSDTFLPRTVKQTRNILLRDNDHVNTNDFRNENELLEYINYITQIHSIPGMSISVAKNENIIWNKHFGYANIEEDILVNDNTMFILSSVSKTITATALMLLYENNLFLLEDDINDYLPFEVNHPTYPSLPITFKMLLSHTSGIRDNWNFMPYYNGDSPISLSSYLNQYFDPQGQFYDQSMNFINAVPGFNFNYSNIGAALIGLLVEEISNQSFNEYCNENIFIPLGMNNTYWLLSEIEDTSQIAIPYQFSSTGADNCYQIGCGIYDENNSCFCDLACSYYDDCCSDYEDVCGENGSGSSNDNLTPFGNYGYSDYPSGQLRSTSSDLAKLMTMYMNDGFYNDTTILNPESIELVKTIHYPNINNNQGLIWYYKNLDDRILIGHNGGDIGSLTEMFISQSDTLGVIVLSNSSNYEAIIQIENAVFEFAENNNFTQTGDVNLDYAINILDVVLVVNLILNQDFNQLADFNFDNVIDVTDIVQLINIILG